MNSCPCGTKRLFSNCCEPYLNGTRIAETPEILMRSRYTAYSLARIDYIVKTIRKIAAENYNADSARTWAMSVTWLGLTVINTSILSENKGTVTFFARFLDQGIKKYIFEKSDFEKINDEWFYVDGREPTINRNEHCPCGSGKKSKRCCLKS